MPMRPTQKPKSIADAEGSFLSLYLSVCICIRARIHSHFYMNALVDYFSTKESTNFINYIPTYRARCFKMQLRSAERFIWKAFSLLHSEGGEERRKMELANE